MLLELGTIHDFLIKSEGKKIYNNKNKGNLISPRDPEDEGLGDIWECLIV